MFQARQTLSPLPTRVILPILPDDAATSIGPQSSKRLVFAIKQRGFFACGRSLLSARARHDAGSIPVYPAVGARCVPDSAGLTSALARHRWAGDPDSSMRMSPSGNQWIGFRQSHCGQARMTEIFSSPDTVTTAYLHRPDAVRYGRRQPRLVHNEQHQTSQQWLAHRSFAVLGRSN